MLLRAAIDLPGTLLGGQAFRWRRAGDAFEGVVEGRLVRLSPAPSGVEATGAPRATLERHLRIGREHDDAILRLSRDAALAPALGAHPGLRILRQEPWETTVAFITSANNNVRRIEGIVERLADAWGAPIDGSTRRAFPDAATLARATEAKLRAAGLGYRAPFVKGAARMVARGDVGLSALRGAPLSEVRDALLALPGVGPKVADCIALFALGCDDAFPLDRWMLRAVSETLLDGREVKPREAETLARERWGRDAGLAQQYLFHAARMRARVTVVR